jgi:hypothetical protein
MIHIRPMTPEDFERFWPTFQSIVQARETYAYDPQLSAEQARQLWLELPLRTLVAEQDGELLGSYFLKANAAGPGAHVVAKLMCEHSQKLARQEGFLALQFNSVVATNEVAVALWHTLGFETVGRLPKAYRHARLGLVDCLVMYKWLADEPVVEKPALLIGRKNIEARVSRRRGR